MPPTVGPPLLDMLGARWRVGAAPAEAAWDSVTGMAGFALNDGTLALAHPVWDGAPGVRPRDGGGTEIVAGTAPAPPAARVKAHHGACVSVAADPNGGFLTGGADGRVTQVQVDGRVQAVAHLDGPISMVAAGPGHWRGFGVRDTVHRIGGTAGQIKVSAPVSALALSPEGARMAIGYPGGVTVWSGGDAPPALAVPGHPTGLCWSADGAWLACVSADGMLRAWRWPDADAFEIRTGETLTDEIPPGADVAALCALAGGGFAAGADGRIVCWYPPAPQVRHCGVPNRSAVTRLCRHPTRALLAAGYANGTAVLCQPGTGGFLLLRAAGEGAVRALAFSRSGACLAIGTDGGEIGLVALPDALFRDHGRRP